jgi:hypothetical protein
VPLALTTDFTSIPQELVLLVIVLCVQVLLMVQRQQHKFMLELVALQLVVLIVLQDM